MSTFNILLQHLSFMGSYYGGWKLKTLTLFCLGGEKRSHPDSSVATADTLRFSSGVPHYNYFVNFCILYFLCYFLYSTSLLYFLLILIHLLIAELTF